LKVASRDGGTGQRSDHLVSIIVPVFNAEKHLESCVDSILAQDYPRLEVLLVDDGSTDRSGEICDHLAARDPRVKVIHQTNGGIGAAQNRGLEAAAGSLITFCDNDDLMSPRMIGRLVDLLSANDADMSCCRWHSVGESAAAAALLAHQDDPPRREIVFDDPGYWYQREFSLLLRRLRGTELRYFSEANWGKLYRREVFDGVRFPVGHYAQDVAVAMDLYARIERVASCEDALYFWVQHPHSVSHAARGTTYFHDIVRAHGRSFDLAVAAGVTPCRAYGGMRTLDLERKSIRSAADEELYRTDRAFVRDRVATLTARQRMTCWLLHRVRRFEVLVYRLTVHRRR